MTDRQELDELYERMFLADQSAPDYADGIHAEIDEWLRRVKAGAWDEGFKQGGPMHDVNYDDPSAHRRNPYRREVTDDDA